MFELDLPLIFSEISLNIDSNHLEISVCILYFIYKNRLISFLFPSKLFPLVIIKIKFLKASWYSGHTLDQARQKSSIQINIKVGNTFKFFGFIQAYLIEKLYVKKDYHWKNTLVFWKKELYIGKHYHLVSHQFLAQRCIHLSNAEYCI